MQITFFFIYDVKKSEEVISSCLENTSYFQNVVILPFDSPAPKGAIIASRQETNSLTIYEIIEKSKNSVISGILRKAEVPNLFLNNPHGILFHIYAFLFI